MLLKTMSRLLMAAGLLAVLVSLGADLVGIGSKGIHAAQFLGALAGFGLFLLGAWLTVKPVHTGEPQKPLNFLMERVPYGLLQENAAVLLLLAGFLAAFIWFFIIPTFFNERLQFQYFYR